MNEKRIQQLRELCWRRALNEEERVELGHWLDRHPDARTGWEDELELSRAIQNLPDAPVASNFTTRVMDAVERDGGPARQNGRRIDGHWWRRWLPKFALVILLAGLGLWQYFNIQDKNEREMRKRNEQEIVAHTVQAVAKMSSVASPEMLSDLEAISELGAATPDTELLSLLE